VVAGVPADRYGRGPTSRSRLLWWSVLAMLVAAGVAWAGWVAFSSSHSPVRWSDGDFAAVDDGHARLTFEVTTAPRRSVVCTLQFFNTGLTEVGRMDVDAGPSEQGTFSVTAIVPTFEQAASGSVRDCAMR
jgi:Domain of unknown function (DUF4307)